MQASPDTIWAVPAYLPYLQPPLTTEMIQAAEERIGYKLPAEYLELLRVQNGGYIRFTLPDSVHDVIAGIGPHFPSLFDFDWDECDGWVSFPLNGLVPFDGDGHWHICLDYRQNKLTPSITYIDIESDLESPIAPSFKDYLAELVLDFEDECVLECEIPIEEALSKLSAVLGVRFDPPRSWDHGYPECRAGLGTESDPQWVFISPNTVARGFVRESDSRYSELKDLMPGKADRFPGLPPHSYIVSTTDGVRTRVIEACARASLKVRLLRECLPSPNNTSRLSGDPSTKPPPDDFIF